VASVGRSLLLFLLAAGILACRCSPSDRLEDGPEYDFMVLAVFLGCQAPSANVELPECPPDSSRACRGYFHWCRNSAGKRNGPWIRLFENGEVSLQIGYQDGQRHGPWIQWHPNGRKWKEGAYNGGREHGTWKGWYKNGRQAYIHEYDNDSPTGHWIHWDENGYKVEEATFR
jgi:hypothetical protein